MLILPTLFVLLMESEKYILYMAYFTGYVDAQNQMQGGGVAGEQGTEGLVFDKRPFCRPVGPDARLTCCFHNGQFRYLRFCI